MSVVSDYEIIADGLRSVLRRFPDHVDVVAGGEAADVDVALWANLGVPRRVGRADLFTAQRARHLVVLCGTVEATAVQRCLEAGARGYLSTRLGGDELLGCLQRVNAGEIVVSEVDDGVVASAAPPGWPGQAQGLSEREGDIVALIAAGLPNQQIADDLFLSVNTVKSYVRTAYQKMGVTSRSRAVLWAVQHGVRRTEGREQGPG